jgi:KDO2-lipid IV(A) lauroyltransferase
VGFDASVKINGTRVETGSPVELFTGAFARLRNGLRKDSTFWRRALHAGVHHGPEAWVRYTPPIFGVAFGAALGRERRTVLNGLRLIHGRRPPHLEARDVAEVFANFASAMTDAMLVGSGRGFRATNRPINDWYLQSSMALGRGVIVATAQTAGWDVAGGLLTSTTNTEVLVVMEREQNEAARQVHDQTRNREGVRVVHVGDDPLASLPLLRHLKGGGIVALKFDRMHPGMRAHDVTFFGRPWRIPAGPLHLAAITGAPIVPVFTRRLGFLEYQPISNPPIYVPRRPDEAAFDAAAGELASRLEAFVRAYPTQWIRFHE